MMCDNVHHNADASHWPHTMSPTSTGHSFAMHAPCLVAVTPTPVRACYAMAALHHSAITWVLRFSVLGSGSQVVVSGCWLQLMHCTYLLLLSRDFVRISESRILRYLGQVVQGQDVRMRECKAELRRSSRRGSTFK